MTSRVQKWGNSLAVRIPKSFALETGITAECPIEISLSNGKIVIAPLRAPKYTLEELLSGITEENRHPETDWGPPVGKEIW